MVLAVPPSNSTAQVDSVSANLKTFERNIINLSRNNEAALVNTLSPHVVRMGSKDNRWTRKGAIGAEVKTGRLVDTPYQEVPISDRVTAPVDYHTAVVWEQEDKDYTVLSNPQSEYVELIGTPHQETQDQAIVNALIGNAAAADGTTTALPASQNIDATVDNGSPEGPVQFGRFTEAFTMFEKNKIRRSTPKFILINADLHRYLLNFVQLTSSDYTMQSQLLKLQSQPVLEKWVGFNWIITEEIPVAGTVNTAIAYTADAVGMQMPYDLKIEPGTRYDKSHAMQVYAQWAHDAVRLEDDKVITIDFDLA